MSKQTTEQTKTKQQADRGRGDIAFGVNEMRLNGRQWLAVAAVILLFAVFAPRFWLHAERFITGADYRIPYPLSDDYWLYQRRLDGLADLAVVPVFGDSVVWGEYVRPDGTLTHFLNGEIGGKIRFANCGVNGVFPLAMEGLIDNYAGGIRNRKVVVQCNLLWMSSPKADLSAPEEEPFNHSELVPQGFGSVPSYRADAATRLAVVAARRLGFFAWVKHVDDVYFDQKSLPVWTLEQDDSNPPRCPNAWRNPLARITLEVPSEPVNDAQRGPSSPRHRPWNTRGAAPSHFDWVPVNASLQWRAFQRTVQLLRDRGNHVLVILGPFNEHMVATDQLTTLHGMRDAVAAWLAKQHVVCVIPGTLPSDLYADASHPLTQGYSELARRIAIDTTFRKWLGE